MKERDWFEERYIPTLPDAPEEFWAFTLPETVVEVKLPSGRLTLSVVLSAVSFPVL